MADAAATGRGNISPNDPVYQELSLKWKWILRGLGLATLVMLLFAVIFCLVKGSGNHKFYLLVANLIISSIVGLVNVWWYRRGDLPTNKYWYMIVVAVVIIFQCFTADIIVFNLHHSTAINGSEHIEIS